MHKRCITFLFIISSHSDHFCPNCVCESRLDQQKSSVPSIVEDEPMEPVVKPRHSSSKLNTFQSPGAVNNPV